METLTVEKIKKAITDNLRSAREKSSYDGNVAFSVNVFFSKEDHKNNEAYR